MVVTGASSSPSAAVAGGSATVVRAAARTAFWRRLRVRRRPSDITTRPTTTSAAPTSTSGHSHGVVTSRSQVSATVGACASSPTAATSTAQRPSRAVHGNVTLPEPDVSETHMSDDDGSGAVLGVFPLVVFVASVDQSVMPVTWVTGSSPTQPATSSARPTAITTSPPPAACAVIFTLSSTRPSTPGPVVTSVGASEAGCVLAVTVESARHTVAEATPRAADTTPRTTRASPMMRYGTRFLPIGGLEGARG